MPKEEKIAEYIEAMLTKVEEELEDFVRFIEPLLEDVKDTVYEGEEAPPMNAADKKLVRVGLWAAIKEVAQKKVEEEASEVLKHSKEILKRQGLDPDDFIFAGEEKEENDPLLDKIKIVPPKTKEGWN